MTRVHQRAARAVGVRDGPLMQSIRPHSRCVMPGSSRFRRCALSRTIAASSGSPPRNAMQAFVYKSLKKADTYLYLAARDDFSRLPEPLRDAVG